MDSEEKVAGTLSATPLSTVLTTIAGQGRSGVLKIEDLGEIWFHQGRTYLAATPSSPDLADVLFDGEVGSSDAIADALGPGANGEPVDSAVDQLLAQHPESEDVLMRLFHEFNLNSLFEMLVPNDAPYTFKTDLVHPVGTRFAEDTPALIKKAEQRTELWRRIAVRIPSTSAVFTLCPSLPAQADERLVTSDEWRFLSQLNGRNTVADVITRTGESAFRVCSSLYRMLLQDLIEEADPA